MLDWQQPVSEVMAAPPALVSKDQSVDEAAHILDDQGADALLVCNGKDVVGFVTAEDIERHLTQAGTSHLTAGDVCHRSVLDLALTDSVRKAVDAMHDKHAQRAAVIGADGFPAGVLSLEALGAFAADDASSANANHGGGTPLASLSTWGNRNIKERSHTMNRIFKAGLAAAFGLGLATSAPIAAADEDVKLSELPKEARSAVETMVGNGQIEEIERDVEEGETVYEVEYERDGEEYELTVSERGRIIDHEED